MTAKTLAYVLKRPLIGVPTFHVLAGQSGAGLVDVLADAQKDAIYLQSFRNGRPLNELQIVRGDDWLAARDPHAIATGPGLSKIRADVPVGLNPTGNPSRPHCSRSAESFAARSIRSPSHRFTFAHAAEQQLDARGR
jgi:tRNA A37 threonylcarbamoyladenosine modification protein TsaB